MMADSVKISIPKIELKMIPLHEVQALLVSSLVATLQFSLGSVFLGAFLANINNSSPLLVQISFLISSMVFLLSGIIFQLLLVRNKIQAFQEKFIKSNLDEVS